MANINSSPKCIIIDLDLFIKYQLSIHVNLNPKFSQNEIISQYTYRN